MPQGTCGMDEIIGETAKKYKNDYRCGRRKKNTLRARGSSVIKDSREM
jgi:hypothetical protein